MSYINYHEDMRRGTDDFPIEFYPMTATHPRYHMTIHWHVEFEFVRVTKGTLSMTINEHTVLLEEGTAVFVASGLLHSYEPKQGCVYDCIVFDPHMLTNKSEISRKFIRDIMNHKLEIRSFYDYHYPEIIRTLWTLFDTLAQKKEGYELIVQGTLLQFLGIAITQNYSAEISTRSTRDLRRMTQIKQALEYIETNFASPLTLQEMSASAQMSPKYFCKFFREMTHRSPIDYLNYYRIERACQMLLTSDQSITDIAYSTGFNDLSYFIKIFKRYKKITPKQYTK